MNVYCRYCPTCVAEANESPKASWQASIQAEVTTRALDAPDEPRYCKFHGTQLVEVELPAAEPEKRVLPK